MLSDFSQHRISLFLSAHLNPTSKRRLSLAIKLLTSPSSRLEHLKATSKYIQGAGFGCFQILECLQAFTKIVEKMGSNSENSSLTIFIKKVHHFFIQIYLFPKLKRSQFKIPPTLKPLKTQLEKGQTTVLSVFPSFAAQCFH